MSTESLQKQAATYATKEDHEVPHTWDVSSLNKGSIAGYKACEAEQAAKDAESGEGFDEWWRKELEWDEESGECICTQEEALEPLGHVDAAFAAWKARQPEINLWKEKWRLEAKSATEWSAEYNKLKADNAAKDERIAKLFRYEKQNSELFTALEARDERINALERELLGCYSQLRQSGISVIRGDGRSITSLLNENYPLAASLAAKEGL